ncbi:MAG: hypothetical protein ACRDY1_15065 [Acidimicrobiales bacterium]
MAWRVGHSLWAVGGGVVIVALAALVGVWFFVLRSPGTRVDLHQALTLYRRDQRAPVGDDAALPETGVYRYRTTGGEQLSMADIHRSFPPWSDIIVTAAQGCATMTWEPLVQHTEGWTECPAPAGGTQIVATPSYEQIAGVATTTEITCPPGMDFVPRHPRVGQRWQVDCHAPSETVTFTGAVLGRADVRVGAVTVPALHLHVTLSFHGAETGSNPNDLWVSAASGLILRQTETTTLSQKTGPLGSISYGEQMTIRLASVTPDR